MYKGKMKKSVLSVLTVLMLLVGSVVAYAAVKSDIWVCIRCRSTIQCAKPVVEPAPDSSAVQAVGPCISFSGQRYSNHKWMPAGRVIEE